VAGFVWFGGLALIGVVAYLLDLPPAVWMFCVVPLTFVAITISVVREK